MEDGINNPINRPISCPPPGLLNQNPDNVKKLLYSLFIYYYYNFDLTHKT